MFYSVYYQAKPNFSLRENKKMHIIGYLVKIGSQRVVVVPDHLPVVKNGKRQFWFYYNHQPMLAIQQGNGVWTSSKS